MKKTFFILALLSCTILVFSQNEKDIRVNKVKSITTWQDENGTSCKDTYEAFDKNGNTTMLIRYKKDGSVDSKETFRYDKSQNKVEEYEYNGSNAVVSHKQYTYNAFNKRTEEKELGPNGELIRKTTITYSPSGQKTGETITDSKGLLIKQVEYSYNTKKLRTQRITKNKQKQVESVKKWSYEYF